MAELICPVCKNELFEFQKVYKCINNHSFDVSKYGVLNLLMSNKSSKKRHGDDSFMVIARKNFLDKGYYSVIKDSVVSLLNEYCDEIQVLLDAGCGEGYYTKAAADAVNAKTIYGIDVSKQALRYFKKRCQNANSIVASIYKMPIKSKSIDVVLNMFAPSPYEEFYRILNDNGILIRSFVLKNHLFELKQAVYDNAYYNDEEPIEINGFTVLNKIKVNNRIHIEGEDIKNLFCMTPYYYKTGKSDQQKLELLEKLDTTIEIMTAIYKKD